MRRIFEYGFILFVPCCQAITLFSIENWYHEEYIHVLDDTFYYRDWRVVKVDVSTGTITKVTDWWYHCSVFLHRLKDCGSNNYPLTVLYNGDDKKKYQRTEMLSTSGSIFDLVGYEYTKHVFQPASGIKMADMNDGFPYAAWADGAIPNQVSVYTVGYLAPGPVSLGHIATIVMDSDRSKYGLWQPEVAIAAGCAIKMSGGCNIPSSFVYVSVGDYGSHGGLHVISRNNGTITKIPVSGIKGYPSDMGIGFSVLALWVDLNVNPQTKVVFAGYHYENITTVYVYEIDLATGIASQKVVIPGIGQILDLCTSYDNAERKWYMGCSTIATVSVDTWKVIGTQAVHHDNNEYSLAGLEFLRDSPVLDGVRRDPVTV